jgi:hypothetical protein
VIQPVMGLEDHIFSNTFVIGEEAIYKGPC